MTRYQKPAHTILYVDDDLANLRVFERIFLNYADYKIETSSSATQALALLRQNAPDLVMLDLNLPDMCAYVLAEEINSTKIPIVAVSGQRINPDHLDSFSGYVAKPYRVDELKQLIHTTLNDPVGESSF
jgi:CheY-like chemotaxis protein